MERYICFYGSHYYPFGGMDDCIGSSSDLQNAIKIIDKRIREEFNDFEPISEQLENVSDLNWGHIYDYKENKIVWTLDGKELSFFRP
jgi:hypothetical protein